jgi:hypothetical protein
MSQVELDTRQPANPFGQVYHGLVARAPTLLSDLISVTIPDIHPDLLFNNVNWQSRDNVTLPAKGDDCVVIFDHNRQPWVVTWWPRGQNPYVVNGRWLKGVSGAAVWTALTQQDVTLTPYGTTLPASPFDGQEAVLVDSVTAPTYTWRFRYNAGSTTGYKWEFIGGADWYSIQGGTWTFAAVNTWYEVGPTFMTPRAGIYNCLSGFNYAYFPSGGAYYAMYAGTAYDHATISGVVTWNTYGSPAPGVQVFGPLCSSRAAIGAGKPIRNALNASATNGQVGDAWLNVVPVAVA